MRVSIIGWMSGLVLISSVASADPIVSVSDQQKLCAATAELLGKVRMDARVRADNEKMLRSRNELDLMASSMRATTKRMAADDHLEAAKAISNGASFVSSVVRGLKKYPAIRLPMDLMGEDGPVAHARAELRASKSSNLECEDKEKEFVCVILKPSGKITNKIAAIFRDASKKGADTGNGKDPGMQKSVTKSQLDALKNCPGHAALMALDDLRNSLDQYEMEARGKTWSKYPRFQFSLPMGEKSLTDDAAQKILKVNSSGTQNGLECSNTKATLTCSFGIGPSKGIRFKILNGVHDVVTEELAAKTEKVKARCGKKDTVFEENKDAPPKQGQDAV